MIKCAWCDEEAKRQRGNGWYCIRHDRYIQIKASSKLRDKKIPTYEELDEMVFALGAELNCPVCSRRMSWSKKYYPKSVITIQHDIDGGMRLICQSCNTRHAAYPKDSYYTLAPGYKKCPRCNQILPYPAFGPEKNRFAGVRPFCKSCDLKYHREWDRKNVKPLTSERREYQRKYRAKHKIERKEYMRQYYLDNRERLLAKAKAKESDS